MGLNKDFIGREFKPIAHEVSEDEVIAYASAIGARNLCYFARDGATSLDSFAAKLSYNWLVDVMPLVPHILGCASEYEKDYKPHPVFVH